MMQDLKKEGFSVLPYLRKAAKTDDVKILLHRSKRNHHACACWDHDGPEVWIEWLESSRKGAGAEAMHKLMTAADETNTLIRGSMDDDGTNRLEGYYAQFGFVRDPAGGDTIERLPKPLALESGLSACKAAVKEFRDHFLMAQLRAQGLEIDVMARNGVLTLESLFVKEDHRGAGLAKKAMKVLLETADKHGVAVDLEVGSDESGIGLVDWYQRLGFVWKDTFMQRDPQPCPLQTLSDPMKSSALLQNAGKAKSFLEDLPTLTTRKGVALKC